MSQIVAMILKNYKALISRISTMSKHYIHVYAHARTHILHSNPTTTL